MIPWDVSWTLFTKIEIISSTLDQISQNLLLLERYSKGALGDKVSQEFTPLLKVYEESKGDEFCIFLLN